MTNLRDQLKQALNALTNADMGERHGRRAMVKALFPKEFGGDGAGLEGGRCIVRPSTTDRWIALGVGVTLPEAVMDYAVGVCERMGARLLLVTAIGHEDLMVLLQPYQLAITAVGCETELLTSASRGQTIAALRCRSNLLFAISGTSDDPLRDLARPTKRFLEQRSPVPVVVIGDGATRCRTETSVASRPARAGKLRNIRP
jgi:hypothetical protein